MATLDSFFPEGATRGDGRKFRHSTWTIDSWFEPIFKDVNGVWAGLDEVGDLFTANGNYDDFKWQEYKEPPKTKKVKMYCPVYVQTSGVIIAGDSTCFSLVSSDYYSDNKSQFRSPIGKRIVGWLEQEVEVTE